MVELLVARGLPRRPYVYHPSVPERGVGPKQMRCLRYVVEKGCPIHPGTLSLAAVRGDTDCVRYLHERGVKLW
jgi:hypothetical protein